MPRPLSLSLSLDRRCVSVPSLTRVCPTGLQPPDLTIRRHDQALAELEDRPGQPLHHGDNTC